MKSEKISSDLLKKYAENTCTQQERIIVEKWLNSSTFDDIPPNLLFENNKEKWRQEIWESLCSEVSILKKKKKLRLSLTNISKYAACAAIFVAVIIGLLQKETLKNNFFNDQKLASRIVQVCDQPTFIVAEHDSEIVFVSADANQEDLYHKVNCEKGNTYLAIMVKYKSTHEILVIDQRDIQNLPPCLEIQIANQIKS